eukprot:c7679_g1_i1.p1 GENE.c7679_g1_i1~~c7679_g1_i1.p1  ORF type:complete len:329 (-),score=77.48 c7679_g1_i1:81-1067(-)
MKKVAGLLCLVCLIATWVAMSELLSDLQKTYHKPCLLVFLVHAGYIMILPFWPLLLRLRRRSAEPSDHYALMVMEPNQPTRDRKFIIYCFFLTFVVFVGTYAWYLSLPITIPSANNAIFQSCCAFVFLLSIPLLKERITVMKSVAVIVSMGGVVLVTIFHDAGDNHKSDKVVGYALVLVSTFIYALYEITAKKYGPKSTSKYDQVIDACALVGMLGFFSLVFTWPAVVVVHYAGVERFEMPNRKQTETIILNMFLDTLFNFFLIFGIALTSPLFISVGTMLVIPVTLVVDILAHHVKLPVGAAIGGLCIVAAFFFLHFDDRKRAPTKN